MFEGVDALVTDISSVGLDFLYAHPEKPIVLTDRRSDRVTLEQEAPIARGCAVVDDGTAVDLRSVLREAVREDSFAGARAEIRRFYFGGVERGESTKLFVDAVERLILEREVAIQERREALGGGGVMSGVSESLPA